MNLFFAKKAGLTLDDVLIYELKQLKRATIMAARLFHVMYVFKKRGSTQVTSFALVQQLLQQHPRYHQHYSREINR